jgi:hypothetical protein
LYKSLTTCFFIKNVRIVGQQEKDARNQILVTQKQVDLAQTQIDLMANQYRESLRPLVAVSLKQEGSNSYVVEFRNEGLGPALNLSCTPDLRIDGTVIGSKSAVTGYAMKSRDKSAMVQQLFTASYDSLDGEAYCTSFIQQGSEFFVINYRHLKDNKSREMDRTFAKGFTDGIIRG